MNYLKDIAREYALRNTNEFYYLTTPIHYKMMIYNKNILESLEESDPKSNIHNLASPNLDDFEKSYLRIQNYFDSILLRLLKFEDTFDDLVGDYKHEHLLLKEFHKMR